MSDRPRPHHYEFAYRAMPGVVLGHARQALAILVERDATRFLTDLWRMAGERVAPDDRLPEPEFAVSVRRTLGDLPLVVVTLPPPQRVMEAHMLAVAGVGEIAGDLDARYFTLEAGIDAITEAPLTFVGEWTEDGTHHNHGTVPAPDIETFITAISDALERARQSGSGTG